MDQSARLTYHNRPAVCHSLYTLQLVAMRVLAGVCVLLLLAQQASAALLLRTDTGPSKYARSGLQRSPEYQESTG